MREVPRIKSVKIFQDTIIPQKSLSDLNSRIENATLTNHISEPKSRILPLQKVLIIDDAIGSNATAHSIAQKLLTLNPELKIYALGIVGSYKGIEPIRDV